MPKNKEWHILFCHRKRKENTSMDISEEGSISLGFKLAHGIATKSTNTACVIMGDKHRRKMMQNSGAKESIDLLHMRIQAR
jgi:hypothetical protein